MITLTEQQNAAADMAERVASAGCGLVAVLSGFAGCGKTTALKEVLRRLPGTLIIAPTATAARRASVVTGSSACTLHKWRYEPTEDENGRVMFWPLPLTPTGKNNKCVSIPSSRLLVIEEGSMVARENWASVYDAAVRLRIAILVVGDSFQLNPVDPDAKVPFNLMSPDFKADDRVALTEPQRTAREHPIFRVATALRSSTSEGDVRGIIRTMPRCPTSMARRIAQWRTDGVDHVAIVHSNAARMQVNKDVRRLLGKTTPNITAGEPALVRRNNDSVGIVNGEIIQAPEWEGVATDDFGGKWTRFRLNGVDCITDMDALMGRADPPRGKAIAITEKALDRKYVHLQPGYAVTCHAAQGNEWSHVAIELSPSLRKIEDPIERTRWLYTGWTRAREHAEVVI